MERSWFGTVRMLELEIGVMVAIVLMALLVITARLARDPSESAVRWLSERARSAKLVAPNRADSSVEAAPGATVEAGNPGIEGRAASPEWLDRLLGRGAETPVRAEGSPEGETDPKSGRRVA